MLVFYHALVKYATTQMNVNTIDLCLIRSLTLMLNSMMVMCKAGEPFWNFTKFSLIDKKFFTARCFLGGIGWTSLILSLLYIPLHLVGIIQNTSTFWIAIMGVFILHEKVGKVEIISMIGCFAGVIVLMLAKQDEDGKTDKQLNSGQL